MTRAEKKAVARYLAVLEQTAKKHPRLGGDRFKAIETVLKEGLWPKNRDYMELAAMAEPSP